MTAETPAPVPSGVDDLRDRVAAVFHRDGCDDPCPGNCFTDAELAMSVVGPELARHNAELEKAATMLGRFAQDVADAIGVENTTDIGELGEQVQAKVTWLQREFVASNNTNADWVAHDLRQREKLARLSTALRDMARRVTKLKRARRALNQRWHDILLSLASTRKERDDACAERDRLAAEVQQLRQFVDGITTAIRPEVPAERGEAT